MKLPTRHRQPRPPVQRTRQAACCLASLAWFSLSAAGLASLEPARALMDRGDMPLAREACRDYLQSHPDDPAAQQLLREIDAAEALNQGLGRGHTRDQLLRAVDLGWERPRLRPGPVPEVVPAEEAPLHRRLRASIVSQVSFNRLPLPQAVEALAANVQAQDPTQGPLNLVVMPATGEPPVASLTLQGLTLGRVLDLLSESVGYEYEVQDDAILLRPAAQLGPRLETAFLPVSRSTVLRLTGLGAQTPGAVANKPTPEGDLLQEERALRAFLQRAGIPFDGIEGACLALADGQLIVTQTRRHVERIRNLLQRYADIKQVEIEARFIEVQQGDLEELGFNWLVDTGGSTPDSLTTANRNLAAAFPVGGQGGGIALSRPGEPPLHVPQNAPTMPNAIDLGAEAPNPTARISGVLEGARVDLLVRALERKTGNDLMSAPKVTVLSGKTAEIVVAQELRYPEAYTKTDAEVGGGDSESGSAGVAVTAGTPQNFTVRNVGVEMQVTPTVEEGHAISLRLEPQVTEFEGFVEYGGASVAIASGTTVKVPSGFFQPIFSVRRVRTEVTIWDGATVVMGGLTREQAVTIQDKIPVLGDIPLLGRLFRSTGESSQKRNLLIFVTANLIGPGGAPALRDAAGAGTNALWQSPSQESPGGTVPHR